MAMANEPAFPCDEKSCFEGNFETRANHAGLTKREYIAVKAWQQLIYDYGPLESAKQAIDYADAFIARLEKDT